eukprot:10612734-Heterocapsa_arctica.AAC.1
MCYFTPEIAGKLAGYLSPSAGVRLRMCQTAWPPPPRCRPRAEVRPSPTLPPKTSQTGPRALQLPRANSATRRWAPQTRLRRPRSSPLRSRTATWP